MNRLHRCFSSRRGEVAQTIYQTMLVLACIALAIAIFFPLYDLTQLKAPFETHKFASASYAPRPATTPAQPAPEAGARNEGEAAPAATEAPKPVETGPGEEKSEPAAPAGG